MAGGVERFENLVQDFGVDAGPAVGDLDAQGISLGREDTDRDRRAGIAVNHRISAEVSQDLRQVAAVEKKQRAIDVDFEFEGIRRRQPGLAKVVDEIGQPGRKVDFLAHRRSRARNLEYILDDIVDAQGMLVDDLDHAAVCLG